MPFWTYILHCRGGVLYTGHTDNLERRVADHQSGLVAGFTQDRQPIELAWSQDFLSRYEALAAERQIKGWSRAKKLALIGGDWERVSALAKSKSSPSTSSGRTGLEVASELVSGLVALAQAAHPNECCGVLLGEGARITAIHVARNVHPKPQTHFEIDPQALIDAHRAARDGGPQVLGYYHSHPAGPAEPSATDRDSAAGDGRIWAVIAGETVRFWQDLPDGFEPLSYGDGRR